MEKGKKERRMDEGGKERGRKEDGGRKEERRNGGTEGMKEREKEGKKTQMDE